MTATTFTKTRTGVSPERRDAILDFAAETIHPDKRTPEAVIAAAESLLAWAGDADHDDDQVNRMRAMNQVYVNTPRYRIDRDQPGRAEYPARPTAEEFLASAALYYQFITADA